MSFPFFTDKVGTTTLPSKHVTTGYRVYDNGRPNDTFNPTSRTDTVGVHTRSAKIGGPWVTLPGTSTKFRFAKPYERSCFQINERNSSLRYRYPSLGYTNVWECDGAYYAPSSEYHRSALMWNGSGMINFDQNQQNRADTEALLKLQEGKAQLGAALAEMKSTFNQVSSAATSLFGAFLAAKRGNWPAVARRLGMSKRDILSGKFAANQLLAYQFGWLPLMQDIHDGIQFLSEELPPAMLIRAERQIADSGSPSWSNMGSTGVRGSATGTIKRWHGCTIFAKASASWIRKAALGGLVNPASIAWEVTPFSFVIDWGIPIGNVLEGLTATVGLDFVDGYRSLRGEGNVDVTFLAPTDTSGVKYSGDAGGYSCDFYGYRRERLFDFPRPMPYVRSPFSTGRAVTALALFRQLFR